VITIAIVDYSELADRVEKRILGSDKISGKNKSELRKFLDIYDVTPARVSIFLNHIKYLLEETQDIKKDMNDSGKINMIFRKLRKSAKNSHYATIVSVSLRFVRWLNDGEKPKGFKDIKGISKKKQNRELSPQDMITWEDAERLIAATPSIQIKAIIATQLDGGLRPSEFVGLNYGDANIKGDFIILDVKKGKTGPRNVTLWRAVPHFLKWYKAHPSKKKDSPLWVQEDKTNGNIIRYKYPAIRRRVNSLFNITGLDKPSDFYNLRHSACVLSKKDNVPEELAAAKFGHSVEYYVNTYGRLSTEDVLERYSRHYGLNTKQEAVEKNIKCGRCDFINVPKASICEQCGNPLSLGKAIEMKKETENRIDEIHEKFAMMEKRQKVLNKAFEKNLSISNKNILKEMIKDMFRNGELNPNEFI
jgi:integrase